MIKVSVIVPVFGVEKYIERCARSLFEQSLKDLEYIFVDDCTEDLSIKKLEDLVNKYPDRKDNVKIIRHEYNMGLPSARKTGLKYATGEYIIHCDSDDWVSLDAYEKMYNLARERDYDIVICGYARTDGTAPLYRQDKIYLEACKNKKELIASLLQGKDLSSLCNKLVKRKLYDDKHFIYPIHNMWEDYACTIQLFYRAKKIGAIDETFYWYYINPESICGLTNDDKVLQRFSQIKVNVGIIVDKVCKEGDDKLFFDDIIGLKYKAKSELMPLISEYKYWKLWFSAYSEINSKILFVNSITLKQKVKFLLALLGIYIRR